MFRYGLLLVALLICYAECGCPSGYVARYGARSCYRVFLGQYDWADAAIKCKVSGGVLAIPSSASENSYMRSFANSKGARGNVWIGLNDLWREGTWVNMWNRRLVYTNWVSGEPNDYKRITKLGEDCAQLVSSGKWNDNWCDVKGNIICEAYSRWD